jgi:hypothetical protein
MSLPYCPSTTAGVSRARRAHARTGRAPGPHRPPRCHSLFHTGDRCLPLPRGRSRRAPRALHSRPAPAPRRRAVLALLRLPAASPAGAPPAPASRPTGPCVRLPAHAHASARRSARCGAAHDQQEQRGPTRCGARCSLCSLSFAPLCSACGPRRLPMSLCHTPKRARCCVHSPGPSEGLPPLLRSLPSSRAARVCGGPTEENSDAAFTPLPAPRPAVRCCVRSPPSPRSARLRRSCGREQRGLAAVTDVSILKFRGNRFSRRIRNPGLRSGPRAQIQATARRGPSAVDSTAFTYSHI